MGDRAFCLFDQLLSLKKEVDKKHCGQISCSKPNFLTYFRATIDENILWKEQNKIVDDRLWRTYIIKKVKILLSKQSCLQSTMTLLKVTYIMPKTFGGSLSKPKLDALQCLQNRARSVIKKVSTIKLL